MPLTAEKLGRLTAALEKFPKISSAWLFGSWARGQEQKDSDFDIGLLCSQPLTLDENLQLQWDLVPILECDRIDLASLRNSSPILCFEAISGVELLRRDEDEHARFCSLTSRLYESTMVRIRRDLSARVPR
ncbi:nucleotidyltransferase domain-containing protein [bacterium]|nr:nucleotidyltransferase domain-containing protein [bacterium]